MCSFFCVPVVPNKGVNGIQGLLHAEKVHGHYKVAPTLYDKFS